MTPRPRPSGGSPRLPQHLRRFRRQLRRPHQLQQVHLYQPPLLTLLLHPLQVQLQPRPSCRRPHLPSLLPLRHRRLPRLLPRLPLPLLLLLLLLRLLPLRLPLPLRLRLRPRPPLHLPPRLLLPRLLRLRPPLHLLPRRHRLQPRLQLPHLRRPTRLRLLPRLRLLRLRPTQLSQRAVSIRARSNQTARRSAGAAMGRDRLRRRPARRSRP